jgi:Arc/MetJ-type ribon-helix-helix transcriptional regulator
MHLPRVYEPGAHAQRVRYAVANILRDRVVNEGAFRNCFEMEDASEVIRTILRRGLKNPKLRTALERSHLVDLTQWLLLYPDLHEAYYAAEDTALQARKSQRSRRKEP